MNPITEDINVDHRIPVSKEGKNDLENLQIAHSSCNFSKHDTLLQVELARLIERIEHYQQKGDTEKANKWTKLLKHLEQFDVEKLDLEQAKSRYWGLR